MKGNQETIDWMITAKQNHLNKLSKLYEILVAEIAILDKDLHELGSHVGTNTELPKTIAIYLTTGDNEEIYNPNEIIYLIDKKCNNYNNVGSEIDSLNLDNLNGWITFKSKEKANDYIIKSGSWLSCEEIHKIQFDNVYLIHQEMYKIIYEKLTRLNKLFK